MMVLRLSEVSHADGLVVVDCQSRPGCQDTVTIGVGDVFLRSRSVHTYICMARDGVGHHSLFFLYFLSGIAYGRDGQGIRAG